MIGQRSVRTVKTLLHDFGLQPSSIHLGEIEIEGHISFKTFNDLDKALRRNDFEVLKDKEMILAEKIKNVIIEMICFSEKLPAMKYSCYISRQLGMNYAYLSRFFSNVKNFTIEKFIILQKIERIKQLLLFDELSLSDIASMLRYGTTGHLCSQFKKLTGITPAVFKKLQAQKIHFTGSD